MNSLQFVETMLVNVGAHTLKHVLVIALSLALPSQRTFRVTIPLDSLSEALDHSVCILATHLELATHFF